jgi:4-deoxy-L-threo-5-hexosulose-uronate ketol-isomerase
MEVRYLPNQNAYQRMTTEELRKSFVMDNLFQEGAITMVYCDADRAIVGGAVPSSKSLKLEATKKEMAAEYFTERREIGVVNIGGTGVVRVDKKDHTLAPKDVLYIGKGKKSIEFLSSDSKHPAAFYFVSYPAHQEYPDHLAKSSEAEAAILGSPEAANKRRLNKFIHAGGVKSCQLVMGLTELEPGCVWNTMPAHTHQRRSEVYMYFGLDPDSIVVHLMGKPEETRSVVLRNQQAVISPSWSVHCGAATRNYSFIWAMGGENQEFSDMDVVSMKELL